MYRARDTSVDLQRYIGVVKYKASITFMYSLSLRSTPRFVFVGNSLNPLPGVFFALFLVVSPRVSVFRSISVDTQLH